MHQSIITLLFILFSFTCFAHGDLGRRIAAKTKAIAKSPNNSELYLQRGFLYQQHEEWDNALADYMQAKQLGQKSKVLPYRMAEVYLELSLFKSALTCTKQYLLHDSIDVKIHQLRGRLFFKLENYTAAIQSFQYVIQHAADLRPENFLLLANVYFTQDPSNEEMILETINQGIQQLGAKVFILQEQKLHYLQQFHQVDATIQQYDLIISNNKRKEGWYYKKANYLYLQKKYTASKIAVEAAQSAFNQLKTHKQKTKAMMQLLANIHLLNQKLAHNED